MKLTIYDKATIMIGESLSQDDYNVLSLLYQPIIGASSYSLYLTLYSLVNRSSLKTNLAHNVIMDIIGVSLNTFKDNRKKLEAIGLLNTYAKDDEYVYLLKTPLSARQFLNDGILGIYLEKAVGETIYDLILKNFQIAKFDKQGYTNVSESFDKVYKNDIDLSGKNNEGFYLDKRSNKSIDISEFVFDFEYFVNGLGIKVNERHLIAELEEKIIKTAYAYNLNEDQMQQVYFRSLVNGSLSETKLSREAKLLSQHNEPKPTPEGKNFDMVCELKKAHPQEIILRLIKNPTKSDYDTITHVMEDFGYEDAIINVILIYVLKMTQGTIPHYNYFDKVIQDFKKANVETFEDAMAYAEKKATVKKDVAKKETAKKENSAPSSGNTWLDKFMDSLKEK